MSPELIQAIKERITAGQTKEEIETAVLAMGHVKEVFEAAYTLALHDMEAGAVAGLTKVTTLFSNAWNFAKSRPDLIGLLFIPLALEVIVSFLFGYNADSSEFPPLPLLGALLALGVVYVVTLATTLYIVTKSDTTTPTLGEAAVWTLKHAIPLFFVYLLSGLAILGGFILFIIPGIIVAVALTFAQYAYVSEDARGMNALLASRQVVAGRWFTVAKKIVGFILLSVIPMILLGILYGIVEAIVGGSRYSTLGGELLTQLLSAAISLMSLHAMFHLYQGLKSTARTEPPKTSVKVRYGILIALSAISIAAFIAAVIYYRETFSLSEEMASPLQELDIVEESSVPAAFALFPDAARGYAEQNQGSFAGVCDVLRPLVDGIDHVVCNSDETSWALEVVDGFGVPYCTDIATPGKENMAPLGEKTKCIGVGE